ncbi:MAG: TetR/AcrR family transcriptional regulator [Hydrococcus sp. RU_2_2]|nr:TetR/AcrR family transcriptional regulator [Hydrococcus sp. RU_2_2]
MPTTISREDLLDKSFPLFIKHGYSGISMSQLAEGLGVSTETLERYFPNKKALFEQLLEGFVKRDMVMVAQDLKDAKTMLEHIEGAFYFLSRHQENYFKQALIFADFKRQLLNEGDDLSDSLKQVYANFDRSLSQFFGVEDPQLIDLILCMSDGLIWQQIYGLGHGDYEGNAKLLTKMITAYLNSLQMVIRLIS